MCGKFSFTTINDLNHHRFARSLNTFYKKPFAICTLFYIRIIFKKDTVRSPGIRQPTRLSIFDSNFHRSILFGYVPQELIAFKVFKWLKTSSCAAVLLAGRARMDLFSKASNNIARQHTHSKQYKLFFLLFLFSWCDCITSNNCGYFTKKKNFICLSVLRTRFVFASEIFAQIFCAIDQLWLRGSNW